ncbi:hypothetical protein BJ170DRAFT_623945 [Xylariales sp. AK1849]|nr:hypothetical protein BJ170DRAFT_623945 [Xylariales sp. AK1849]
MKTTDVYTRVPDELKLKIWSEAIPASGISCFKVEIPDLTRDGQKLRVQPMGSATDPSTWLERWNIYRADPIARGEVLLWAKKLNLEEKALWNAPFPHRKRKTPAEQERAMVHGKNDIVCITVAGTDFDFSCLDAAANRQMFRGLQKIGLDFRATETGRNWVIKPFQCFCLNGAHKGLRHCPAALEAFLRLFPSMRCFYFIYRIDAKDIRTPPRPAAQAGEKRTRGGQVVRKPAAQVINEALAEFRVNAMRKKLEIISDAKRTYYEVQRCDSAKLADLKKIWKVMNCLEFRWPGKTNPGISNEDRKFYGKTKFKVLVCRHRQGPGI